MTRFNRFHSLILFATVLFFLFALVPQALAAPPFQLAECGPGTDCYEPVSPEPDEYYAITCTTNALWVWVTMPAPLLVTFVPLFQVVDLGVGEELAVTNGLTVTRSGDTITLSGSNGNRAPEPGAKSFSWNECVARNGGLPEIPGMSVTPSAEQVACRELPTETEIAACLATLAFMTCDNYTYAITHQEECDTDNCENILYAAQHIEECTDEDSSYEILFAVMNACFNPVGAGAAVVSFAAFRSRRRRK